MKNPYILSRPPEIPRIHNRPLEELQYNYGNFLFLSAVSRLVKTNVMRYGLKFDVNTVREECDGIVIPAANWLQSTNDYSNLARLIEAADLPTVITGLGAQSLNGAIPELHPGMLRFLKAISERSKALSVRGDFSAEVLNHYGIKNVVVTGCPSLLWHLDRPAAVRRQAQDLERVTINATVPGRTVPKRANPRMLLARLLMREGLRNNCDFVMQTEVPMLAGARGEADADTVTFLKYVFENDDYGQIESYLQKHLHYFGNAGDWIAYSANQDAVIGSRLHGVISALLAGTPAVLVTHDTRTVEMGEKAKIPTITAQELMEAGSLDAQALIDTADFDAFNRHQATYFDEFIDFFDENDVPHRLGSRRQPPLG